MANIYFCLRMRKAVSRRVRAFAMAFAMICFSSVSLTSSAQEIVPSINLECEEDLVDFDLPAENIAFVHCTLENPNAYSENVDLTYQTGELTAAGPGSVTVASGSEVDFQVNLRADSSTTAGNHEVNITAQVTQAAGIPVGFLTEAETHSLDAFVPEFLDCEANYGQSSETVEAGEPISISSSFSCSSNLNQSFEIELHLVQSDASEEGKWPSGFNDLSDQPCSIEISGGSGLATCQFVVSTPTNLVEDWTGCLVILPEEVLTAQSCSVEGGLMVTVKAKEAGTISVGFGEKGTLLEDLGVSEELEPYVIGGALAMIAVAVSVVVLVYRRRQSSP